MEKYAKLGNLMAAGYAGLKMTLIKQFYSTTFV